MTSVLSGANQQGSKPSNLENLREMRRDKINSVKQRMIKTVTQMELALISFSRNQKFKDEDVKRFSSTADYWKGLFQKVEKFVRSLGSRASWDESQLFLMEEGITLLIAQHTKLEKMLLNKQLMNFPLFKNSLALFQKLFSVKSQKNAKDEELRALISIINEGRYFQLSPSQSSAKEQANVIFEKSKHFLKQIKKEVHQLCQELDYRAWKVCFHDLAKFEAFLNKIASSRDALNILESNLKIIVALLVQIRKIRQVKSEDMFILWNNCLKMLGDTELPIYNHDQIEQEIQKEAKIGKDIQILYQVLLSLEKKMMQAQSKCSLMEMAQRETYIELVMCRARVQNIRSIFQRNIIVKTNKTNIQNTKVLIEAEELRFEKMQPMNSQKIFRHWRLGFQLLQDVIVDLMDLAK